MRSFNLVNPYEAEPIISDAQTALRTLLEEAARLSRASMEFSWAASGARLNHARRYDCVSELVDCLETIAEEAAFYAESIKKQGHWNEEN